MSCFVQMFAFNAAIAKELKERVARMAGGEINSKFKPSAYQQAIFDWIETGTGSCIVHATAGSGKSTTCLEGLRHIPGIDLTQVRASTFHSVGFGALCKKLQMRPQQIEVDGGKVGKLLRETLDEDEYDLYGAFAAKLVGLAKGQGFGAIQAADERDWAGLISHHDLFLESEDASEERAIEIARAGLRASNEAAKRGVIDFDDQLYLPLLWKLKLWQNDWVIVDECQDTSPTRRALAKLALRPGGRLMAVGDEKQSVTGFAGADCDAMELIRKEFSCIDLPLTVSYRCGRAIVAEAHKYVGTDIEAAPNAPEGQVVTCDLDEALKILGPKDAILCRNVSPLVELAFRLIGRGVGCHVLGKEIGTGLISLIKKQHAKGLANLEAKLERYREREVAKFTAKGEENRAEQVEDKCACIAFVIARLHENERTIPALIAKLEGLFSDANGVLTLSTMHRSKGKEWTNVGLYRPELCPSKWARQDWQQVQERNLSGVAVTRARLWFGYIVGEGQ